jgi:hypothetical protein
MGFGFWVLGSGIGISGFGVWGLGSGVWDLGLHRATQEYTGVCIHRDAARRTGRTGL